MASDEVDNGSIDHKLTPKKWYHCTNVKEDQPLILPRDGEVTLKINQMDGAPNNLFSPSSSRDFDRLTDPDNTDKRILKRRKSLGISVVTNNSVLYTKSDKPGSIYRVEKTPKQFPNDEISTTCDVIRSILKGQTVVKDVEPNTTTCTLDIKVETKLYPHIPKLYSVYFYTSTNVYTTILEIEKYENDLTSLWDKGFKWINVQKLANNIYTLYQSLPCFCIDVKLDNIVWKGSERDPKIALIDIDYDVNDEGSQFCHKYDIENKDKNLYQMLMLLIFCCFCKKKNVGGIKQKNDFLTYCLEKIKFKKLEQASENGGIFNQENFVNKIIPEIAILLELTPTLDDKSIPRDWIRGKIHTVTERKKRRKWMKDNKVNLKHILPELVKLVKGLNFDDFLNYVSDGQVDNAASLLNGHLKNDTNEDGETPLFISSTNNYESMVYRLLTLNPDPNIARTTDGATPLFIASENGHLIVVQYLLEYQNTEIDKATTDGATPLFIAAKKATEEKCTQAMKRNYSQIVYRLLDKGAIANEETQKALKLLEEEKEAKAKAEKAKAEAEKAKAEAGTIFCECDGASSDPCCAISGGVSVGRTRRLRLSGNTNRQRTSMRKRLKEVIKSVRLSRRRARRNSKNTA